MMWMVNLPLLTGETLERNESESNWVGCVEPIAEEEDVED